MFTILHIKVVHKAFIILPDHLWFLFSLRTPFWRLRKPELYPAFTKLTHMSSCIKFYALFSSSFWNFHALHLLVLIDAELLAHLITEQSVVTPVSHPLWYLLPNSPLLSVRKEDCLFFSCASLHICISFKYVVTQCHMIPLQSLTTALLDNMTFNISLLIPLQITCKCSDHTPYMELHWRSTYSVKTESMFLNFVYYPVVHCLLQGIPFVSQGNFI